MTYSAHTVAQPVPISAHDLAIQWNQQADQSEQWDSLELYEQLAFAQSRAIAADRARHPALQPVAVSERPWEKEAGWLDLDGECWWCPPDGPPYWSFANPAMVYGGWVLPANALPLPQGHDN